MTPVLLHLLLFFRKVASKPKPGPKSKTAAAARPSPAQRRRKVSETFNNVSDSDVDDPKAMKSSEDDEGWDQFWLKFGDLKISLCGGNSSKFSKYVVFYASSSFTYPVPICLCPKNIFSFSLLIFEQKLEKNVGIIVIFSDKTGINQ